MIIKVVIDSHWHLSLGLGEQQEVKKQLWVGQKTSDMQGGDWLKSTPTAGTKYHRLHTVIFSQILSRGESIFLPFCPPTSRNHLHSLAHTSLCSVSITSASLSLSFPSLAWKERVRTQGTAGYSRIPGDSSPSAHLHLQACNLISSAKSFFVGNRDLGTLEGEGTFALPDGSR